MPEPLAHLQPKIEHLSQVYVLAQAWKKTVSYIRRNNWYSDPLELDLSAVDLPEFLERLSESIKNGEYKPKPLQMVPAPKSQPSIIRVDDGHYSWESLREDGRWEHLRPLAHVALPDQVVCTAIMMCLADSIETAQWNPTKPFNRKSNPIVSYGNRLFCSYLDDQDGKETARFLWGNSLSYRKYFADYRVFLDRPKEALRKHIGRGISEDRMILASLDIEAFFDDIDRDRLIRVLRSQAQESMSVDDKKFWEVVTSAFSWRWDDATSGLHELLKREPNRGLGIPQGLVASGMLANAYLLELDEYLASLIGKKIHGAEIIDAIRYVDDMRFVLVMPVDSSEERDKYVKSIGDAIQLHLKRIQSGLKINTDKSSLQMASEALADSETSTVMSLVQQALSGPADQAAVREALTSARFLLAKTDRSETGVSSNAFSDLGSNAGDVIKDVTIARFASGKIVQGLRERRLLTQHSLRADGSSPIREVDLEFYEQALNFVRLWSVNPALTIVLRRAMDLCPNPMLLRRIQAILEPYLTEAAKVKHAHQWHIAWFTIADLLRAGATETGLGIQPTEPQQQKTDLEGYRRQLAAIASTIMQQQSAPWYAMQQAMLFLAFMNMPLAHDRLVELQGVKNYIPSYRLLHSLMGTGRDLAGNITAKARKTLVVALRLMDDPSRLFPAIAEALALSDNEDSEKVIETLTWCSRKFMKGLVSYVRDVLDNEGLIRIPRRLRPFLSDHGNGNGELPSGEKISLMQIISRSDNVFSHENNLLVLAEELLQEDNIEKWNSPGVGPRSLLITLDPQSHVKWSDMIERSSGRPLQIDVAEDAEFDPRYEDPCWVTDESNAWRHRLGALLRAAVIGSDDFSEIYASDSVPVIGQRSYRGYAGNWSRRQYGLVHDPIQLTGASSTVTTWTSELLMHLLAWPGSRFKCEQLPGIELVTSPLGLRKFVTERRKSQLQLYGKSSGTHIYRELVDLDLDDSPSMTVVLVQTCRPLLGDFNSKAPDLSDPAYRAQHRDHIASVLNLVDRHLSARVTLGHSNRAHLIIFPELSVHEDDLPRLEMLSQSTKAIILCGLVFRPEPRVGGQLVNSAAWLLRRNTPSGTSLTLRYQGKKHLIPEEHALKIASYRPSQIVIEAHGKALKKPIRMTASICYDATDIKLAADLRDITDFYIIPALNKDVDTFDAMASAYRFHMYQHVALVNSGEFGGTLLHAPLAGEQRHERVRIHNHGNRHISISIAEVDLSVYAESPRGGKATHELKSSPAGYVRHPK